VKRIACPLIALAAALLAPQAHAAACAVVGIGPVAFGAYDPFAIRAADSAGDVAFRCTGVAADDRLRIELDFGRSASGAQRRLRSFAGTLDYQLYLDSARTQVWGDGAGGTNTWTSGALSDGVDVHVPVYGRIRAGQNVPAGAYADTITVTVEF